MPRQIIRAKDVHLPTAPRSRGGDATVAPGTSTASPQPDDYRDRLMKLIPGETVALYLMLQGMAMTIQNEARELSVMRLVAVVVLLVNIPYMMRVQAVKDYAQLVVIEVALVVWIITLHGKLLFGQGYDPIYGSMLVVLYTAVSPLLIK